MRVVLRDVEIPRLDSEHSPFKFTEVVELADGMTQSFSIVDLPALRKLKVSIPAVARGFLPTRLPQIAVELKRFVDGPLDDDLKANAKSATLTFRIL